jgi:fumarate hydratase class II
MVVAQVVGNDAAIAFAGASGNFELNVMLPVMARNLLESIRLLANTSRLLADRTVDGTVATRSAAASWPSRPRRSSRRSTVHRLRERREGRQAVAEGAQDDPQVVLEGGYVDRGELTEAQLDEALDVLSMTRAPQ